MYALTAAHKRLPFQTRVRVTNLENGEQVVVRINDRGPFRKQRIIDLSLSAAKRLNMIEAGTARVRIEKLSLPTARAERYSLQLGSFKQRDNALSLKRKARDLGLSDIRVKRAKLQGRRYYRVLAGQFTSRREARAVLDQAGSHFPDSFILVD
jgi:rare lipoprotein A